MSSNEEFAEGAHALTHRQHKVHHLRVASGYPIQPGIGAYNSPGGMVTSVQTPPDNTTPDQPTMSPDQFGGGSAPAPAGDSGSSGGGATGGGM